MKDMASKLPNHSDRIINIIGDRPACPVRFTPLDISVIYSSMLKISNWGVYQQGYLMRACLPRTPGYVCTAGGPAGKFSKSELKEKVR